MKKLLTYSLLILFCCSTTYSSQSCTVHVSGVERKQVKEKQESPEVDMHPLSIFSQRY